MSGNFYYHRGKSYMSEPTIRLELPPAESLRIAAISRLGYPGPDEVSQKVMACLDREVERCLELAAPRALCELAPFRACRRGEIEAEGVVLKTVNWARLVRRMSRVRYLCCLAVTLGKHLDETIAELGSDRLTASFILDAAASALAEILADEAQQQIRGYFNLKGWRTSLRFSPGYCDWEMKNGQENLCGFLHPQTIGIQASPASGMMTPRKSITAVMVVADEMPAETPCYLCARDCPHRREPYAAD